MPGVPTSSFLLTSRALPQPSADGTEREQRASRYGSLLAENVVPTKHTLADEGSYFITNNGIANPPTSITGQTSGAFTNTAPTVAIVNTDSPSNASAKRIFVDYIYLNTGGTAYSSASLSNVAMFCAVVLDNVMPVFSGSSTLLTPVLANMDMGTKSIALIRVGAMTIAAPSSAARTISGQRLFRAPVSSSALTLINLDQFLFNFGGVDVFMALPNSASATFETFVVGRTINMPPIVIGPGQSAYIYIWSIVTSGAITAGTLVPEIGHWER